MVGIRPDTVESHAAFREKHRIGVQLLADPSGETLRGWGACGTRKMYGRDVEGVIRSTVLVDPQGRVAWHWPSVRAEGHARQVKEKLEELRGARPAT